MFEVYLSTKAKKELENIEKKYKGRVVEALNTLMLDPIPIKFFDVKKLVGIEDTYRIRIGKIRIVYSVLWKDKIVLVARIGFRGKVY